MPVDLRLRPLIRFAAAAERGSYDLPIPVQRERSARTSERLGWMLMRPGPEPAETTEREIPVAGGRIRVRLYRPAAKGPLPLYVFLHGGGWCFGTLDERDPRCRTIAAGAACLVASVDYRLAPEFPYPTAPEDCYAALGWLVEHADELGLDPARVAIGGESAGANLAAAVCLMARERQGPRICHQWLDVPLVDATLAQSGHREVSDGYLLDAARIDEFLHHYVGDSNRRKEPTCSPLLAEDHRGLPPAWIMGAEFDRLRGDAEAYARSLSAAGVAATHVQLERHIHASFAFTRLLPSSRAYEARAIAALAQAFSRPPGS